MSYKIIDLPELGRQFNATDIIEVSADGTGSYKANIGDFTLGGENYIFVNSNGTPEENGNNVRIAYQTAQALTPNGNGISAENRVVILLAPGYYTLNEAVDGIFEIYTSYIDFQSLTGERDVYFSSIVVNSYDFYGIDVRISGIDTTVNNFYDDGAFVVFSDGSTNENIQIKNCKGGDYSFSAFSSGFRGIYENCEALRFSFGHADNSNGIPTGVIGVNASQFENYGIIKNCTAVSNSFCWSTYFASVLGSTALNYGTIDGCVSSDGESKSFCVAYTQASNYGTIKNCQSGEKSFVAANDYATNYGTIENCQIVFGTKGNCFVFSGTNAVNEGLISNCQGIAKGDNSFVHCGTNDASSNIGRIFNCYAPDYSNSFCTAIGLNGGSIDNCVAKDASFCADNLANLAGQIRRCTMGGGTWNTGIVSTAGGRVMLGIDNIGVVNVT